MEPSPQLSGGSENYEHYHPEDRIPTHDTLSRLQNVASQRTITTTPYTATYNDDHLLVGATCSVTMPSARAGKELEITMTSSGTSVTILPNGSDTLVGYTSVVITQQWTSLRFKAISGGWIII